MRILIVTETYPPNVNGAALATERLAEELAKKHEVSVVAPSTSFKYYKKKQGKLTIYRLKSILIQKRQQFRVSPQPFHAAAFKKILHEVQPDIMHINNPGFIAQTAISAAKEHNIPVIGTSHFMPENLTHYLHLPGQIEKVLNTSIWKLYAKFYSRLNLVISPTQTAADLLTRLHVGTKVQVISNGIDLKKFHPTNKAGYLKERYKLPKKLTLLFVGRLDKEKNIDVLIRAFAIVRQSVDVHMVIVGKGKEDGSLHELADELGVLHAITFTGYLPKRDLHNIYKVGDIFVMPSIAELQSLVTMEAMGCGLPVVGANAVALPHLIKDGKNGYLFKSGNHKELAQKLLKLLQDEELRRKMGKESLAVISEHEMSHVIQRVEDVYKGVIERSKRGGNKLQKEKNEKEKSVKKVLTKLNIKKLLPEQL